MNRSDKFEQIRNIADAICAKEVNPEQINNLDNLLRGDPDAQQFYYDYIEMHIHMKADVGPSMEVVRRRLQVDEVIFRPSTHNENPQIPAPAATLNQITSNSSSRRGVPIKWLIISILLTAVIAAIVVLGFLHHEKQTGVADLFTEDALRIEGQGKIESNRVYPGIYSAIKPVKMMLTSGEQLTLTKNTFIKLYNGAEIEIIRGHLSVKQATGKNLVFNTPSFTLHSGGGEISIDLTKQQAKVISSGSAHIQPKRWRPNHYWPFESDSDRVADYAGNAFGILSTGVTKVNGLVGNNSFLFNNSANARINVGSGGGTVPATGSFSVIDGVTIEALIVPHFKGQENVTADNYIPEQDQIFRKDQTDKHHRMLLSLKNAKPNSHIWPNNKIKGNTIAFGMYLIGHGYHTLLLPLDGKQGRPSLKQLKDGKAHHVVASYDVSTGLKAIFVDGKMQASYQYPKGTKMISGGSGMANIGNSPNRKDDREAYAGIIDEVAFYDFALPPYIIKQHYEAAMKGKNYFNVNLANGSLPLKINIPIPENKVVYIDSQTGLINRTELIVQ